MTSHIETPANQFGLDFTLGMGYFLQDVPRSLKGNVLGTFQSLCKTNLAYLSHESLYPVKWDTRKQDTVGYVPSRIKFKCAEVFPALRLPELSSPMSVINIPEFRCCQLYSGTTPATSGSPHHSDLPSLTQSSWPPTANDASALSSFFLQQVPT